MRVELCWCEIQTYKLWHFAQPGVFCSAIERSSISEIILHTLFRVSAIKWGGKVITIFAILLKNISTGCSGVSLFSSDSRSFEILFRSSCSFFISSRIFSFASFGLFFFCITGFKLVFALLSVSDLWKPLLMTVLSLSVSWSSPLFSWLLLSLSTAPVSTSTAKSGSSEFSWLISSLGSLCDGLIGPSRLYFVLKSSKNYIFHITTVATFLKLCYEITILHWIKSWNMNKAN